MKQYLILLIIFSSPLLALGANDFSANFVRSSSQYAYINDNLGVNGGVYTISAWVQSDSTISAQTRYISRQENDTSDVGYRLYYVDDSGAKLGFQRICFGVSTDDIRYSISLTNDEWYLVTGMYDGSDMYLYVNGVQQATGASSCTGSGANSDHYLVSWDTGASYWDGNIDEMLVYDTNLDGTEILALYNDPCNPETGYVARYEYEEDWTDSTANGYDLTTSGSPTFEEDPAFECEAEGGGDPFTATTTPSTVDDVVFGLSILIFLNAMVFLGLIFKTGTND